MRIKLTNFANISSIDYELENGKVNFLFGISGAGKSSVAKSLISNSELTDFVKAGKTLNDCNVEIIDSPISSVDDIAIYNYSYMESVLLLKDKLNDMYQLFFSGDTKVREYKQLYSDEIRQLFSSHDQIHSIVGQIELLEKGLLLRFNSNHEYSATCAVGKFQKTISTKSRNSLAQKYSGKRAQWFLDGKNSDEYLAGKCPFCGRKMSDYRKVLIDEITDLDLKSYDKIRNCVPLLTELKLSEPNWSSVRSTNAFKKSLFDLTIGIKDELKKVISVIDATNYSSYDIACLSKITLSKKTKEFFPSLSEEVDKYNANLKELKKTFGKLILESKRVLKKNKDILNEYLSKFNVPYSVIDVSTDNENRECSFYLKHNDDDSHDDRTNWLSYGEKNVVGLILFMSVNFNKKMIVIDDPVGSFDNYRRKIALDFIFDKKVSSSTILILSHDEVFIKIATYYAGKNRKKYLSNASLSSVEMKYAREMGKATFLESNDTNKTIDITENDFGSYADFVKDRLSNCTKSINVQTAILIRLLLESKKKTQKKFADAYEYLSAIIHRTDYHMIMELLTNNGLTESEIIATINEVTGISFSALSTNYLDEFKHFDYSNYELITLCREELKKAKNSETKAILSEMNSITHQSAAYITCLNPFKYDFCSSKTHDYIETFKQKYLIASSN